MSLLNLLAATQPAISLNANAIRVLDSPRTFYSNLQDIIRRAKRRIFLSSLYIGASEYHLVTILPLLLSVLSLALASIPRHRTPSKRPSSSLPQPRLQPLYPPRPRLSRSRPSPPPTRTWLKGPCLPLSQPEYQRTHHHRRPSPLQRGLGDLAR